MSADSAELGGTKARLYACERGTPSWPINLLYKRFLTSAKLVSRDTRSKIIQVLWIALMEIESAGHEVEVVVVENAALDRAEHVGEGARLKVVRVELGVGGKDKSGVCGRLSGISGMKDIGPKIKA